jgi:polyphosphate glucokinase
VTDLAIGIDIGGSGIKAGAVDLASGTLRGDRIRVATPNPSTPDAVVASTARLVARIGRAVSEAGKATGTPVGVGIPSVVIDGHTRSAANIDPGWVDFPAAIEFHRALSRDVAIVNDADAAGVAEMRFGAGRGRLGTVFVLTLGTGVGSALFVNGILVPNTELGHMEIRGRDAERRSAANARVRRGLSWKAWAADLDEHLIAIDRLFSPNVFILGGGVSKNPDKFVPFLTVRVPVVPAQLRNDAGIVGAALFAAERLATPAGQPMVAAGPTGPAERAGIAAADPAEVEDRTEVEAETGVADTEPAETV